MSYSIRFVEERLAGQIVWFAEHPELLGCHALGSTLEQASKNLQEIALIWIEHQRSLHRPIPDPPESLTVTIQYLPNDQR